MVFHCFDAFFSLFFVLKFSDSLPSLFLLSVSSCSFPRLYKMNTEEVDTEEILRNPNILVMQLEGLITPEFNCGHIQAVAQLLDERLYILGKLHIYSLIIDGKSREDFFKMWVDVLEKYTSEDPLKAGGGTVFSIPILVQKPPIEPDSTGTYPTIAGNELLGFVSAMGLAQIPELYFMKMSHKNEGDDHSTGWVFSKNKVEMEDSEGKIVDVAPFMKALYATAPPPQPAGIISFISFQDIVAHTVDLEGS
jgi:hypothetical protein